MGHGDGARAGAAGSPAGPSQAQRPHPMVTTPQPASRFLLFPAPIRSDVTAMILVLFLFCWLPWSPAPVPRDPSMSPVHSMGSWRAGTPLTCREDAGVGVVCGAGVSPRELASGVRSSSESPRVPRPHPLGAPCQASCCGPYVTFEGPSSQAGLWGEPLKLDVLGANAPGGPWLMGLLPALPAALPVCAAGPGSVRPSSSLAGGGRAPCPENLSPPSDRARGPGSTGADRPSAVPRETGRMLIASILPSLLAPHP